MRYSSQISVLNDALICPFIATTPEAQLGAGLTFILHFLFSWVLSATLHHFECQTINVNYGPAVIQRVCTLSRFDRLNVSH